MRMLRATASLLLTLAVIPCCTAFAQQFCGTTPHPINSCVTSWSCSHSDDTWLPITTLPNGSSCTIPGEGKGTCSVQIRGTIRLASCIPLGTTYSLGGYVAGLNHGNSVVLQDSTMQDTVSANGSFAFSTKLLKATAYAVTVKTQPFGQHCAVTHGTGTIASANVTSVSVQCSDSAAHCSNDLDGCFFSGMPLYDQSNPNFAFITVPSSTWSSEGTPMATSLACGSTSVPNPYYTSWLPLGPISGDPGAPGAGTGCGWWYTALCGPTAESMALMGLIANKAPSTTMTGWTLNFYNAFVPAGQVGSVPNPLFAPNLSVGPTSGTPNRSDMTGEDVQRVIDMADLQGTTPNGGGGGNAFLQSATDFTPNGVGSNNGPANISNANFTSLIQSGTAITFAITDFTAHVAKNSATSSTLTFTPNGGGHILAVNGEQNGTLLIYDPVYAQTEWLKMEQLTPGVFHQGANSLTVQLPQVCGATTPTLSIWPDSGVVINSPFNVTDGQIVTVLECYSQLKVQ